MRPTKKQKELLEFIGEFIKDNGYSPSYREIMTGKGYNSVATVAAHVNNLIKRGHLRKRDNSARSLELTESVDASTGADSANGKDWLLKKIDARFNDSSIKHDDLYVLLGALKVLGLNAEFKGYLEKLEAMNDA